MTMAPNLVATIAKTYWKDDSGTIYSAADAKIITEPNEGYDTFVAGGGIASPWPRDSVGAQTSAALDEVLTFYGLPPTGLATPTAAQLIAYAGAKVETLRATPRAYSLGSGVSVYADASSDTVALVAGLGDWGTANPSATQPWIDDFGTVTTITGAQAVTLMNAGRAYIQSLYAELAVAATGIGSGSITTTAQIDALSWPT